MQRISTCIVRFERFFLGILKTKIGKTYGRLGLETESSGTGEEALSDVVRKSFVLRYGTRPFLE